MRVTATNPVLAVHDLEANARWLVDVLGCERSDPDPGNWVFCRLPATTFMLGRCPDVPLAAQLGDHSYIAYLEVDDVDAFHARAVTAGAEILKPPTNEAWSRRELGLRLPEGHRIMLGAPLDRPREL